MFLRIVKATVSPGVEREYVRMVEAYRDHAGKTRHRTIINFGRKDLLTANLDFAKLQRLLHGDAQRSDPSERASDPITPEDVEATAAWDWGPMLAARSMWRTLGLDRLLDELAGRERRKAVRFSDRALALVANRLVSPCVQRACTGTVAGE